MYEALTKEMQSPIMVEFTKDIEAQLDALSERCDRLRRANDRFLGSVPNPGDIKDVAQEPSSAKEKLDQLLARICAIGSSFDSEIRRFERII